MTRAKPFSEAVLNDFGPQRSFSNQNNLQIALPIGGIGAGMVCMNGYGGLQDFAIRNRPATSAVPDGHGTTDAAFATLHIKGKNPVTRLLEGPMPVEKIYNLGTKGQGFREGGFEGLPRFKKTSFRGEFPFGFVGLTDPEVPLKIDIRGYNPFIPLDDKNSGIPCAILEYTLTNRRDRPVDYEFSYHLSHLAPGRGNGENSRTAIIPGGVHLYNMESSRDETCGSAALCMIGPRPKIKGEWFRGGWFDSISALWREVSSGEFKPNRGNSRAQKGLGGRNGSSILVSGRLQARESTTYPILITWHFPNCHYTAGRTPDNREAGKTTCCGASPPWRPYYVNYWENAAEVAAYVKEHYADLKTRTEAFHQALFRSSLPAYVLDAVSANLGILKSTTVLRQENGNAWAWEGCFVDRGCCSGTCTHVWNYAQALPHLFPQIERTFREQELARSMDERGHVNFRSALPDGEVHHRFHPASDGQLGGIMKLYRDWHISGDLPWLKTMYPLAKRSLDFCIQTWDPEHLGVLMEPHHNTYDIEFWGPDGMCSTIYLGALSALAELSRDAGFPEDAPFYEHLAQKGAAYLDKHLFNGEYYHQKVQYKGLRNSAFEEHVSRVGRHSNEIDKLLKREGPKYQYGDGCISDGVIGAWMAGMYGIPTPMDPRKVRRTLTAIFQYNFRRDLSDHACTQRPGYAMGSEPGLLLCSWPHGGKPTLPFVYSDEVWTGIEYQVAAHLIAEGMVKEGLTIVKGVRMRHDGRTRNPWNEYECGNYYARAMASFSVLNALSGFRYSLAKKTLVFAPKLSRRPFASFFSTATGFGVIALSKRQITIKLVEGELAVDAIQVCGNPIPLSRPLRVRAGSKAHVRL